MNAVSPVPPVGLVIDTSLVPARDRAAFWAEQSCLSYHPLQISVGAGSRFGARMWREQLADVSFYRVIAGANTMRRTAREIAAGDPECVHVTVLLRGRLEGAQRARPVLLGPGDLASYDTSHPAVFRAHSPFDILVLQIPKVVLGSSAASVSRHTAVRIAGDSGFPRLAGRFFRDVMVGLGDGSIARDDPGLQGHVIDLVRRLYIDLGTASHPTRPHCAAELLLGAQAEIEARLDEPGLGPDQIARACFISTRYLHRVFASEGLSVCEVIRTTRLERCRADLLDQALAQVPISAIAARWGLTNAPHFSRMFRDAYGCSPREFRASRGAAAAGGVTAPVQLTPFRPAGAGAGAGAGALDTQRRAGCRSVLA